MTTVVYKASDDSEHATAKLAKHRDKLVQASADLERAAGVVQRLLAESALTADGQQLDLGRSRGYWFIVLGYGGMPRLRQVSIYAHNLHVDFDREYGALMIREFESDRKAGGEYVSFKISDLYADEKKAQAALVIACEKRLAEWGQEVAEIRKLATDRKE